MRRSLSSKLILDALRYFFKFHVENILGHATYPLFVYWEVTRRCNLRCIMCDIWANSSSALQGELNINEVKEVIDQLDCDYIALSGGEPLLREDIFDIIQYIKRKGILLHLTTNATRINERTATLLDQKGLDVISVSLDAATAELHDKIRGVKGTFDQAIKALKLLTERNMRVFIQTVIMAQNINELPNLTELAAKLNADGIRFQPVFIGFPYKQGGRELLTLRESDAKKSIEDVIEKTKEYGLYTNSEFYLRSIPYYFTLSRPPEISCLAGKLFCEIDHLGNLYPCIVSGRVMGNLREKNFRALWNSNKFRQSREKDFDCPPCWLNCYTEPSLHFNLGFILRNPLQIKRYLTLLRGKHQRS